MSDEPTGSNCAGGGIKIDTGLDANENGILDATEVQETKYVCNGINGSGGPGALRIWSGDQILIESSTTTPFYFTIQENFDIQNYSAYDSAVIYIKEIIIVALLPGVDLTDAELTLELVDLTNRNTPIPGSQMILKPGGPYISKNVFNNLPKGPFTLGISAKMNIEKTRGYVSSDLYEDVAITFIIARK